MGMVRWGAVVELGCCGELGRGMADGCGGAVGGADMAGDMAGRYGGRLHHARGWVVAAAWNDVQPPCGG